VGKSKFGDIAIDDIFMSSRACTAPGNCDFEDTNNYEYCTWMNLNEKSKRSKVNKVKAFTLTNGTAIMLKCKGNNQYVCAENSGANPLVANRESAYLGAGSWEAFTYIRHDDGTFSLISSANDKYVSGLTTGIAYFDYLHADQDTSRNYTRFILTQNQDGSYSFRSTMNLKYVSASNSGFSPLMASQTTVGDQFFESFIIEPFLYQSSGLFDWEIYESGGIFSNIADHTLGLSGDGHFIIANGKNQGDYSRIFSQILEKTTDTGMCLSFYYYFNGGLFKFLN
jgi:hypothetical protein